MRLKDKVAIITGGSRGIGFATSDKFLKEGASVVLAASSQESADVAVDKLKEELVQIWQAWSLSERLLKRQLKNMDVSTYW